MRADPTRFFRLAILTIFTLPLLLAPLAVLVSAQFREKGFVVTPSRIDAVIRQGSIGSALIYFTGLSPASWRLEKLSELDGVNVTLTPIEENGRIVALNLTIAAYRPGFYRYRVDVTPPVRAAGPVKAVPVIVVPVNILVPGVRVDVRSIEVNPATGDVRLCYALSVFGLWRLNLTSVEARLEVYVDSRLVVERVYNLSAAKTECVYLGRFGHGESHRVALIVESPGLSRDAVETSFVVGRVSAVLAASISTNRLQIGVFGGFVRASYTLTIEMNTSRCIVDGHVGLGGDKRKVHLVVNGEPGVWTLRRFDEVIAVYNPPGLVPVKSERAWLNVTLVCTGVDEPRRAYTTNDILYIDVGVLTAYVLTPVAVVAGYMLAARRRKKRRARGAFGG